MGSFKKKQSPGYRINIEKSFALTLFIIIIVFILFPTYNFELNKKKVVHLNIIVEDIPITKQGAYRPPPQKPAVPIPAEDESIPEDETIEVTNLDFKLSLPASRVVMKVLEFLPIYHHALLQKLYLNIQKKITKGV